MAKDGKQSKKELVVERMPLDKLIPYARNARTHSDEQVAQIAGSIKEFGFNDPIAVDQDGVIIEGHGRVLAARKLGLSEVPVIVLAHMSESQKRAYIIAHNKIALNAGWDDDMLKAEMDALAAESFELSLAGFDEKDIERFGDGEGSGNTGLSDAYTQKIKAPIYTPKGEKPPVSALVDRTKTKTLVAEIEKASLPADVAEFLKYAAERHSVFHFRNIAEFYCHADKKTQDLMERSALIIIDFKKAIENGFVKLTEALGALADQEGESDDEG